MTGAGRAAAAVLACLFSTAAADDALQESIEHVRGLGDGCVYDHGYRCIEVAEDDFLGPNPGRTFTAGPYLEAWSVTHRDFLQIPELSAGQKRLKHYKIAFTEDATHYIVLYQALLLPRIENGRVVGILRSAYGWTTKYWVNRRTLEIDKRLFLR